MVQGIQVNQCFKLDCSLTFVQGTVAAHARRRCDRVKQTATRTGERTIGVASDHVVKQPPRLGIEESVQFKLPITLRESRPAHACSQVCVAVSPWLAHGLCTTRHGNRPESAAPLTNAVVRQ